MLKRDGTGVVQSSACAATSGTWYSPYDGATWTASGDVDIDHVVPLANAWVVTLTLSLSSFWNCSNNDGLWTFRCCELCLEP